MKKKQWKKQDLNLRSSSLKSSTIPTKLPSLVTDCGNILLHLLIHHQTKHLKSNKYTIYHEICINAKSPHPNSGFYLNLESFYHFPPSRMVESPPTFNQSHVFLIPSTKKENYCINAYFS